MPLRRLTTIPPGGFLFVQLGADGKPLKKFSSMGDALQLASEIADFRAGNGLPNATPKEVLHEIEEATCARLHQDPEWCCASSAEKKRTVVPALIRRSGVAKVADAVKRVAGGARVLVDWLGDGAAAVPVEIAQRRANVCLGCPENRDEHSLLELTGDTVRAIAEQMNVKSGLKLSGEG